MTCTGTDPDGFGDGTQNNLTVNVQPGATVNGTLPAGFPVGINLLDNNIVNNTGTISVAGPFATGISVIDNNTVFNTGTIAVSGDFGTGISAFTNAIVTNNGTITALGDSSTGIFVFDGSTVTNNGTITTGTNGTGIVTAGTSTLIVNNGVITVGPGFGSVGIADNGGNNVITNFGVINVGDGGQGIATFDGTAVTNNGTINVGAYLPGGNFTAGIAGANFQTIINNGTINAGNNSSGILTFGGNNNITNNGIISAGNNIGGVDLATGINLFGEQNVVTNNGTVRAGTDAFGIVLGSGSTSFGGHTVINNGTIAVGANGLSLLSFSDSNIVTNNGTLDGQILLNGASNTLTNSGLITITDAGTPVGAFHQIGGDFTQMASGILALRVDSSGNSDGLFADSVTLNGILRAVVQPGLYGPTTTYNGVVIACTCTGLSGTFATVASSSPFFTATATYDYIGASAPIFDPNVSLTLTRIAFGSAPGQTPNELAVSRALDTCLFAEFDRQCRDLLQQSVRGDFGECIRSTRRRGHQRDAKYRFFRRQHVHERAGRSVCAVEQR